MFSIEIDRIIQNALQEDVGCGDVTTEACVPEERWARGALIAKEGGVICGLEVVRRVFAAVDPRVSLTTHVAEGQRVQAQCRIADIEGPARAVLTGERTALNLLQRMSGIATRTAQAARVIAGSGARIADTRKTAPGLRVLDKYAVLTGGGSNHRKGLSDGVLIKDNHIVAAGGIAQAVEAARARAPHTLKIEVEAATMDEVMEALAAKADIIMLDNMTIEQMAEAVRFIAGRALTEASGNMGDLDEEGLRKVAATGVNIISIGTLTHTVRAMDISLKFE